MHIYLDFYTVYLTVIFACFGAVLGSFLDCAAWRHAHGESVLKGRSHCGNCGHELGVRDLFPVFSFLFSRGKCRYCGTKIPRDTIAAELAGAFVFGGLAYKYMIVPPMLAMWLIFAALLLLLALIDHAQRVLPDSILALTALNRVIFLFVLGRPLAQLPEVLTGALSVSVPLFLIVLLIDCLLGRKIMDSGDIKLMFVIGLYLTWRQMVVTLLISFVLATGKGLSAKHGQDNAAHGIAFGSYIAAAALLAELFSAAHGLA